MANKRTEFRVDTQFRIMLLLESRSETLQRELVKAVGVNTAGVLYVLNALVEMAYVKIDNFETTEDKRRSAFILTPLRIAEKAVIAKEFIVMRCY